MKKRSFTGSRWLTSVILATWEAEIRRMEFKVSPANSS
jgi:hypothetical protein